MLKYSEFNNSIYGGSMFNKDKEYLEWINYISKSYNELQIIIITIDILQIKSMDKFKLFVLYPHSNGGYTECARLISSGNVMRVKKGHRYENIGNRFSQNR